MTQILVKDIFLYLLLPILFFYTFISFIEVYINNLNLDAHFH